MVDDMKLAINGGTPAVTNVPGRFHFGAEEKAAVDALFDKAIESGDAPGYAGEEEAGLCKEFADFLGGGFVDGTNSGTTSVFVALKALHLPPFSEVIVGCITDEGGVMPVVLNDCIPIPADVAPGTYAPGPEQIEARITERTKAIVVAHIFGDPSDMPGIERVAAKYNLPIVSDCAQAHDARINGRHVGTFGTLSSFSLMFGKHFCTGGQGGAVFTKDEELYKEVRRAADRGKPFGLPAGSSNVFPSLNFNMDEIYATIGRAQLKKLPMIVSKRRAFAKALEARLIELGIKGVTMPQLHLPAGYESCFWKLRFAFNADAMKCTMHEYRDALNSEGFAVGTYEGGCPFWDEWYKVRATQFPWNSPCYKGDANAEYPLPNMEKTLSTEFFSFYIQESFTDKELDMFAKAIQKVDAYYSK